MLAYAFNVTHTAPAFFFIKALNIVGFTMMNCPDCRVAPDITVFLESNSEIVVFAGFKAGVETVYRIECIAPDKEVH